MKVFTICKPYVGSCGDFLNKEDADRVCEALNKNLRYENGYDNEYWSSISEEEKMRVRNTVLKAKYRVAETNLWESAEEYVEHLKEVPPSFYYEHLKLKEK